ncbi:hypothetical protein NQ318_010713 [Aromia moschata]|uniref:C2H2-type domain-containing protein n=1 Tax=Aromia moschata TaxID=1265417 RepID=A0AAV8XNM8_9CUCU|nr:hypothetical protein NQ318_010713 [Aromia moschata]
MSTRCRRAQVPAPCLLHSSATQPPLRDRDSVILLLSVSISLPPAHTRARDPPRTLDSNSNGKRIGPSLAEWTFVDIVMPGQSSQTLNSQWEDSYLFTNVDGKAQCLVCYKIVNKSSTVRRHYENKHSTSHDAIVSDERTELIAKLKSELPSIPESRRQGAKIIKTVPYIPKMHRTICENLEIFAYIVHYINNVPHGYCSTDPAHCILREKNTWESVKTCPHVARIHFDDFSSLPTGLLVLSLPSLGSTVPQLGASAWPSLGRSGNSTGDCSFCSYKAKRKSQLTEHMLTHKYISEVTTYDCSFCSYKTKRKSYLTTHLLIHKDASEITTYHCSFCSYKTKRKKLFNQTHANSQRCFRNQLMTAVLVPARRNEKAIFVPTRRNEKSDLTGHMLIHKDISECAICPHKTELKRNLTQHLLIHKDASKDASDVTTYANWVLTRQNGRKGRKGNIERVHNDASEVTTYDCSVCSYKAKQKAV